MDPSIVYQDLYQDKRNGKTTKRQNFNDESRAGRPAYTWVPVAPADFLLSLTHPHVGQERDRTFMAG